MKLTVNIDYCEEGVDEEILSRASGMLANSLGEDIRKQVVKAAQATIDRELTVLVTDALEREYQPKDEFGESRDKPTSLKEMAKRKALDFLAAKVDSDGKETNYRPKCTRADWLVKKIVKDEINFAIQKEIKQAAQQARDEMRWKVAEIVAKTLLK